MTTTVVQRGRPRKANDELLLERMTVRMTARDRAMIEAIAKHRRLAPESLLRSWALEMADQEDRQIFGHDISRLSSTGFPSAICADAGQG